MENNQELEFREPTAVYEVSTKRYNQVKRPSREELYESYVKYKAEADAIYGKKKLMTVEEYFGKLGYIVDRYYEDLQSKN